MVFAEEDGPKLELMPRGPKYPADAKQRGVEAIVATAFVVDTAGRVEPRTITFLGKPVAPPEFRSSVCEFLSRARFVPLVRDGAARRAFVLEPFAFALEGGMLYGVTPDAREQQAVFRQVAFDSLFSLLEKQPHCR